MGNNALRGIGRSLAFAVLLGALATHAAAGSPINVSRTQGDSLVPALAVGPGGVVHVVWHDASSGRFEILYSRSGDGGASFAPPVDLSRSPGDSKLPAIAARGKGEVYVAWQDSTGPGRQILLRRSTDGGRDFDPPRPLAPHAAGTRAAAIGAEAGGAVVLVWQGRVQGRPGVVFTRSTDGGRTFSLPRLVATGARERQVPAVALAEGAIYLAWRDRVAGRWEILFARSTDGGETFSPPLNVSRTPGSANVPAIAASGRGRIVVAWQDTRAGTPQIFMARSADGGVTFSAPANVSGTSGFAHLPALASRPDRTFLVWHDNAPGNFEILFRTLP